MFSTGSSHPYDTRYKHNIRPSLPVPQRRPVKKPSKKRSQGTQTDDDAQLIPQQPLEIVSNTPSPLSLSNNAASPEVNNDEMDIDLDINNNDNDNEDDDNNDLEVVTAAAHADPIEDQAMIYNNPQPDDYGHPGTQDVSSPEPTPLENIHHIPDSNDSVNDSIYGSPEGDAADFPMPYYTYPTAPGGPDYPYPALGGPVSEEYESPFGTNPHIHYTLLNDANVMAQEFSTVVPNHSFETELNPTFKTEIEPPREGLGSLMPWGSSMSTSSLNMATAHDHPLPSPLLSDPFSSVSGLGMMGMFSGYTTGEFGLEQIYSTPYPTLERDEQDFSNAAEAMRMQTLVPNGLGLQIPMVDQQSEARTHEDDDGDGGDYGIITIMKHEMETEVGGNEWMGNQDEVMKSEDDVGIGNDREDEAKEQEEGPLPLLRQQLPEERLRNPEPNWVPHIPETYWVPYRPEPIWVPYRPSYEAVVNMEDHMKALYNKMDLSRAGWSAKLLEELFGGWLLGGQWPPPPPPPPPPPLD